MLEKCREQVAGGASGNRYYVHLGESSKALLTQRMEAVDKFVLDTNASTKNEQLTLEVQSYALKRQLAKEVAIKYKESANLYTEYSKDNYAFVVKRWARKNGGATPPKNPEEKKDLEHQMDALSLKEAEDERLI